jgi:ankyrin repeat protein
LLIAAIRKGKVELVKLLLEAGADPNWQVPDTGNTSLHDAVKQLKSKLSKAMSEIIRLLLLKGGDSLRKNKQQKTVYEYAEKALPDYQKI